MPLSRLPDEVVANASRAPATRANATTLWWNRLTARNYPEPLGDPSPAPEARRRAVATGLLHHQCGRHALVLVAPDRRVEVVAALRERQEGRGRALADSQSRA